MQNHDALLEIKICCAKRQDTMQTLYCSNTHQWDCYITFWTTHTHTHTHICICGHMCAHNAQILDTRSLCWPNFAWWWLIFVGPQHGTWFLLPFWHPEFWGAARFLENMWTSIYTHVHTHTHTLLRDHSWCKNFCFKTVVIKTYIKVAHLNLKPRSHDWYDKCASNCALYKKPNE